MPHLTCSENTFNTNGFHGTRQYYTYKSPARKQTEKKARLSARAERKEKPSSISYHLLQPVTLARGAQQQKETRRRPMKENGKLAY